MNKILRKRTLAPNVTEYVIEANDIVRYAKAGQFVIVRVTEDGERVPFTICHSDKENKTITLLVQTVGYSTSVMESLSEGDYVADLVGPLGNPTDLSAYKNILLICGGIGVAVIYPQAEQLFLQNKKSDVIIGARSENLLVYKSELEACSKNLYIMTNDGSVGEKGFVTDKLKELIEKESYDCVFAVGPLPMMKAVCEITKEINLPTIVSMNSIMVDGTGMCGCCRVTVGGETKYACVDGPEFDGLKVDFDEAINRSTYYREIEENHRCRLRGKKND